MYQVRSDLLYSCFRLTCPSPAEQRGATTRSIERELRDSTEHIKHIHVLVLVLVGGQSALYTGITKIILYEQKLKRMQYDRFYLEYYGAIYSLNYIFNIF